MILIKTVSDDQSSNEVIEWLNYLRKPYVRINNDQEILIRSININNKSEPEIVFKIGESLLKLSELTSFWYRRGYPIISNKIVSESAEMKNYLSAEWDAIVAYFIYRLDSISKVNNFATSSINKLVQLQFASECGLNIPDTLITTNKKDLCTFNEQFNGIITKSIQGSLIFRNKDDVSVLYTSEFTVTDVEESEDEFWYTKFQVKIDKKIELRVFYIDGKFYPMAIFSQLNPRTKLDFRRYDSKLPNRCTPYKLSNDLEIKLINLMNRLKLKSGSIDLIVSESGEIYFLEVNPVGQFGMVSKPCNYYLERIIAEIL